MDNLTLLVLSNPNDRELALLEQLPPSTNIIVGNNKEAFANRAAEADAVFCWSAPASLLRELWPELRKVKWIHSRSAGLDSLLFPELIESDVRLTNGSGVFSQSLGEWVVAATLFFAKDLRRLIRNQAAAKWEQFNVEEIRGQTMGIVGYGDIGRACSRRAHAMGMKVLALRRRPELSNTDPYISGLYGFQQINEMLPLCDYVVAAAPLAPGTRGLLGDAQFEVMKKSAIVMNVGRGPVIDEAALVRALQSKKIRGAALDVFEEEPLPAESPLWGMENVLISPHSADHTTTWLDEAMQFFIDNFQRFAKGEALVNVVNKRAGY